MPLDSPLILYCGSPDGVSGISCTTPVFVPERLEGSELIERVQGFPHRVLGQAVLLSDAVRLHEAGHGRGLGQPLLLDQELEGLEATPTGRHLERARLPWR